MTDLNETIKLAGEADRHFQIESVREHDIETSTQYRRYAAAIRALCAKASETCEWKQESSGGFFDTACGIATVDPKDNNYNFTYCPFCGRKLVEKKQETKETT